MTPRLLGLVLAGGASRRMARDKGALDYHGEPQAVHAWRLLSSTCGEAYVSTTASRANEPPYRGVPSIVDAEDFQGPAAGLVAASRQHPEAAWLVVAVDMPLVDRALLAELIGARDPAECATAFTHADSIIEPLCTIWEPAALDALAREVRAGNASPRRFLEARAPVLLRPADPDKLASVNSPEEYEAMRRHLEVRRRQSP